MDALQPAKDVEEALGLILQLLRKAEESEPCVRDLLEVWDDAVAAVSTKKLASLPGVLRGCISSRLGQRGLNRDAKHQAAALLDTVLRQAAKRTKALVGKRNGRVGGAPVGNLKPIKVSTSEPALELHGACGFFVTVRSHRGMIVDAKREFHTLIAKFAPELKLTSRLTEGGIVFVAEQGTNVLQLLGSIGEDGEVFRYCERVWPLQSISQDDLDSIIETVLSLSSPLLTADSPETTFAVRSEGGALRSVAGGLNVGMAKVADVIPDQHEVDLKTPKVVIQLRGFCFAGVRWCGICVAEATKQLCLRSEQEYSGASAGYSYYNEDVNSGHQDAAAMPSALEASRIPLGDADLELWAKRLDKALQQVDGGDGCFEMRSFEELAAHVMGSRSTKVRLKRSAQEAQVQAMLQAFEDGKLLRHARATIEFGAGKGELTEQVRRRLAPQSPDGLVSVLVDRDAKLPAWAGKKDCRATADGMHCLRIDIRNLHFAGISQLAGCPTIGIGKHVCGAATDLALRCLCSETGSPGEPQCVGVGMALCCRHLCNWQDYAEPTWILESGFSPEDFGVLTHMSTWAHQPDERRRHLGFLCKRFLDAGRIRFLRRHGFRTIVQEYIATDCTQENQLLLAVKELPICAPCTS